MSPKATYKQAKLLEKKMLHPFALQGLTSSVFIEVTNKILTGEFGIIPFRYRRKNDRE
jgi:hypothetical protein